MGFFEAKSFYDQLQKQLDRETSVATMDVVAGGEDLLQVTSRDESSDLLFGPYSVSPISGLHFDCPDDTAAS